MSPEGTSVAWVDLSTGQVLLSTNEIIPIVSWFSRGERTDDPSEATHCVAGPCRDDWWYNITIHNNQVNLH